MPNGQINKSPKYLKSFWSIFILVVVSMIAGGMIFAFAYGNMQQDELDSISFWHPFTHQINYSKKAPAKTQVKTTSTTPTTVKK
jgi:hypothetical protein